MSYIVLARKYRPQTFEQVIGQNHVTLTLANAIKSDRVAHAYLFTGTRGVGKTTAARILAKALNCKEHDRPSPEPCNKCVNCTEITDGKSVDVFEIDGASNTGVEDVRDLRENARFMPQSSRHKIYIVDEVHMLSNNAFNALLKTLEEPPSHVIFIFATTEVHKIPDTVLSRCQQYDFKMIPQKLIYQHLSDIVSKESVNISDSALRLVTRKADGSMRDAMSYLDQALSYGGDKITTEDLLDILGIVDRQVLMDLSKGIISKGPGVTLSVLEKLQATTWDVKQFYGDLLEQFRNLLVAKISKNPDVMIDVAKEELKELVAQSKTVSAETLQRLFNILVEDEDLVIRSGNPRLVLEMTLLKMAYAAPVQPLDELVNELAEIKKSLGEGGAVTRVPFHKAPKKEKGAGKAKKRETLEKSKTEKRKKGKKQAESPAREFILELEKKNDLLASYFEQGKLLTESDKLLEFGFDSKFLIQRIRSFDSEYKSALVKVADSGAKIKLTLIEGKKKENEIAKKQRLKAEAGAKMAGLRKESLKNKTVDLILKTFEDTEVSVSPLGKKSN